MEITLAAPAEPYWRAFEVLSAARTAGGMGGVNPIPVSEILAYAAIRGLKAEDTVTLVQAMDGVWLGMVHERLRASARRPRGERPSR